MCKLCDRDCIGHSRHATLRTGARVFVRVGFSSECKSPIPIDAGSISAVRGILPASYCGPVDSIVTAESLRVAAVAVVDDECRCG